MRDGQGGLGHEGKVRGWPGHKGRSRGPGHEGWSGGGHKGRSGGPWS